MKEGKKAKLKKKGWTVGSAQDFLGLSDEETAFIEMRLALAQLFAKRRASLGRTQQEVASLLGSSQSRIAKLEAGDPTVSVDLMLKSLLKLGATRKELGRAIGAPARKSA